MSYLNQDTAVKVAEFLLQIKAVKLSPNEPFTWASGWKAPIYCDNRKTLSYPKTRTYLRQQLTNATIETFSTPDLIAGVATGAIAYGALVAQELGLPFVYVRAKAKEHGLENQIEGFYEKGQSVVVIEDLISTGNSSLSVVNTLRKAGCNVKGMAAIFNYNFKISEENFAKDDCQLTTLSDYDTLIIQAMESGYVSEKDIKTLQEWRMNPELWSTKFV